MKWEITYHKAVEQDLKSLGSFAAKRILRAIDAKLSQAPLNFGHPLTGNLSPFRKLRVGDYRVVYQVTNRQVTVYVLAVISRYTPQLASGYNPKKNMTHCCLTLRVPSLQSLPSENPLKLANAQTISGKPFR